MYQLYKLEIKKNGLFYMFMFTLLILSSCLYSLNHYYFQIDVFKNLIYILLVVNFPLFIYHSLSTEKWSIYLLLNKRNNQLFVKMTTAIVISLIFSVLLGVFLTRIDSDIHQYVTRSINEIDFNFLLLTINMIYLLPGLLLAVFIIFHRYIKSESNPSLKYIFLFIFMGLICFFYILTIYFQVLPLFYLIDFVIYYLMQYFYMKMEV